MGAGIYFGSEWRCADKGCGREGGSEGEGRRKRREGMRKLLSPPW